jgi:hypothetical protein
MLGKSRKHGKRERRRGGKLSGDREKEEEEGDRHLKTLIMLKVILHSSRSTEATETAEGITHLDTVVEEEEEEDCVVERESSFEIVANSPSILSSEDFGLLYIVGIASASVIVCQAASKR